MIQPFFLNNNEKITKHLWLYFGIIVLVNIVFKLIYLDYSPFWYDEIISIKSASEDFGHIKHVAEWDKNPPFYYYCLSVWIKLFNDSEFCSRFLSVLFNSVAAGILFLFANKHFNKMTALMVSLFYISSNILFFYSHEARAYSLVVLLALLSSYIYFNLKEKATIASLILLGLINFLIVYTHYIAALIIIFQTIIVLFCFEKKQKKYFLYSLLILLAFVLIRFTKKQVLLIFAFNSSDNIFWLKKSDLNSLVKALTSFFFTKTLIIPAIILILFGIFMIFKFKSKNVYFTLFYTSLVALGSTIVSFLVGLLTPVFLDRYLLFSIPFILLLMVYPLSFIRNKIIPLSISIAFTLFFLFKIDYKTDKGMDFRGTVSFIKHIKTNEDLIIVKTKDIKPLFCYYYEENYLTLKRNDLSDVNNIIFCSSWNDIDRKVDQYKRVVVIDAFQELNPKENDFATNLSSIKQKYATINYYKGVKISFYK